MSMSILSAILRRLRGRRGCVRRALDAEALDRLRAGIPVPLHPERKADLPSGGAPRIDQLGHIDEIWTAPAFWTALRSGLRPSPEEAASLGLPAWPETASEAARLPAREAAVAAAVAGSELRVTGSGGGVRLAHWLARHPEVSRRPIAELAAAAASSGLRVIIRSPA